MEIKENKRKIHKRIRAAVIATAILVSLFVGTRWFLKRTGVTYPKGVYQPLPCARKHTPARTRIRTPSLTAAATAFAPGFCLRMDLTGWMPRRMDFWIFCAGSG